MESKYFKSIIDEGSMIAGKYQVEKEIYNYDSNRVLLLTDKNSQERLIAKISPIF